MLQEITITPATIVLVLLILAWAVWACRRLRGRGMCDCNDHCGGCANSGKRRFGREGASASGATGASCPHCSVADKMVADLEAGMKAAPAPSPSGADANATGSRPSKTAHP